VSVQFFWGVIWSQHKYTFQLCCYIIQLCISKVVCAARASLEVQEKQVFLLFFRELLLAGTLNENVPCSNDVTVDKTLFVYNTYFTRDSFLEVYHRSVSP
jgi:hypothetical protein